MIMMLKRNDNLYVLLLQDGIYIDQFIIVSELTKKDYDFMLTHFKRIRNCTDEMIREFGNACYYFPTSQVTPEVQVMLYNRGTDDYCIKLNLSAVVVSEMIGVEMDLMIFELECLPNHQCGTPAYFPLPKDKPNDR